MIRLKKMFNSLLSLLILISVTPLLSGQTDEQLARFEEEKVAFFTNELKLSDAESEKFWPLYNDFNNRFMKIGEEERNTLRYFHSNYENMSDQEVSELLEKYMDIANQKHKLEIEYNKKFKEILPEKKVMMLYVAERQFRMHLIRRLKEQGQGGQHRGGKGPGGGGPGGDIAPLPNAPVPFFD